MYYQFDVALHYCTLQSSIGVDQMLSAQSEALNTDRSINLSPRVCGAERERTALSRFTVQRNNAGDGTLRDRSFPGLNSQL